VQSGTTLWAHAKSVKNRGNTGSRYARWIGLSSSSSPALQDWLDVPHHRSQAVGKGRCRSVTALCFWPLPQDPRPDSIVRRWWDLPGPRGSVTHLSQKSQTSEGRMPSGKKQEGSGHRTSSPAAWHSLPIFSPRQRCYPHKPKAEALMLESLNLLAQASAQHNIADKSPIRPPEQALSSSPLYTGRRPEIQCLVSEQSRKNHNALVSRCTRGIASRERSGRFPTWS
jgi:hypothetical protein